MGRIARWTGEPAPPLSGALSERLEDHLCASNVAERWSTASNASRGPAGEEDRRGLRAVADPFIDQRESEPARELERRQRSGNRELELAREDDPAARRSCFDTWVAELSRHEALRSEWRDARRQAVEAAGSGCVASFYEAQHPVPSSEILEEFERGAVSPLDASVASAVRARRLRCRHSLNEPEHAADDAVFRTLIEHEGLLSSTRMAPTLRRLGAVLGLDPDSGAGPKLIRVGSVAAPTVWGMDFTGNPVVVIGGLGGPMGLRRVLGAFGEALRASFLAGIQHDAEWRWSDPAFRVAARVLFRRLILSPTFRAASGIDGPEALELDLRFEEALAPRLAWTYLFLASRADTDPSAGTDSALTREVLRRATGRPATPWQGHRAESADPVGNAELRGTVLALLVEERLLSRFGTAWFADPAARGSLLEIWEAERRETAESVASALDLGTIEAAPILDRCKP